MPTTIAAPQQRKPIAERKTPARSVLQFLLNGIASLLLTAVMLCVVEFIFAMAGVGEDTVISPDPLLGYFMIPDKAVTFRSEGFSRSRTNELGFRDRTYPVPKPKGTMRVAVLGDSVTLGFEVPPEKTFPKLLEQKFHAGGKNVDVLNCGMSGSGTGQQYLLFKEKIAGLQPDILVLAYHAGDTDDNVCGGTTPPRPVFSVNDRGKLQTDFADVDKWLNSEQSRFYASLDRWRSNCRIWSVISRARQDMVADSAGKFLNSILDKPANFLWNSFLKTLPAGKWDLASRNIAGASAVVAGATTADAAAIAVPAAVSSANPVPSALSSVGVGVLAAVPSDAMAKKSSPVIIASGPLQQSNVAGRAAAAKVVAIDNGQVDVDLLKGYLSIGKSRAAVAKSLLMNLNQECRKINCQLIVLALPAFDNDVRYHRELQEIESLSCVAGFKYVPAWQWFPARPPMGQSKYFFELHFNRAGHQVVSDGLWNALDSAVNRPGKQQGI